MGSIQEFIPLSEIHTVDDLIRSLAAEAEDIALVGYPRSGASDYEIFNAKDLDARADAAVSYYMAEGIKPADPIAEKAPVGAILAQSNLEVIITILALNRLGWSIFFLSTRLGTHAYLELLKQTDCSAIITTNSFQAQVSEIRETRELKTISLVSREHHDNVGAPKFRRAVDALTVSQKVAFIIHSSGSTGVPKPIYVSNAAALATMKKNYPMRGFCTSPLFHAHGINGLFRSIYARQLMYFANFALPATSTTLTQAMKVAKPDIVLVVPYILKLLSEQEEGVKELAKASLVLYAGSACPDGIGDRLVEGGVNLATNYGSTETGYLMNSLRPEGDLDWAYLRLQPSFKDHVLMDEISPGLFECVALSTLPSLSAHNSDDPPGSFRTRDIFIPHPDPAKKGLWKYVSRLDDRVTLINGEKVLPIPIESRIRQHELVQEVAVFGIGRSAPGAIIFKSADADQLTPNEFLSRVWPAIDAANKEAESFSKLSRELIIVLPSTTKYPQTPKGTIIRAQLYQEFAAIVDDCYSSFEAATTDGLQLDVDELQTFLLDKFCVDLGVNLESADSDIFAAGVDSLQTLKMWGIIKKQLDLGGRAGELGQNVVFEKGTVRGLAAYLFALRTSSDVGVEDDVKIMRDLIDTYSVFGQHKSRGLAQPEKGTVLLTGATGSLGAFLLYDLVKTPSVSRIWALVRAPDAAAATSRVHDSLATRGLVLASEELAKIVSVPSDLSCPDLSLGPQYDELLTSLTHVIHCAWAVNFNIPVQAFVAQHIQGLHNLLSLCLASHLPQPASLVFCSSLSVAGATPRPGRVGETVVEDLSHAQTMGYARSKLVGEHMVRNAMRNTGIRARVTRIGQIVGDARTGGWNEIEAVPLMVRSARTIGALPLLDENPSWLPVDVCSKAIIEITFPQPTEDSEIVYHLINKDTFSWEKDFLPALTRSNLGRFETVAIEKWLEKLRNSNPDPVENPSIKLLAHWEAKYGKKNSTEHVDGESKGLKFDMDKTLVDCPALTSIPDLIAGGYIEKFVDGWLKKWD